LAEVEGRGTLAPYANIQTKQNFRVYKCEKASGSTKSRQSKTTWGHIGFCWSQIGAKLGPCWGQVGAKLGQTEAKLRPVGTSRGQVGLSWRQVGQGQAKLEPGQAQLGPTWAQVEAKLRPSWGRVRPSGAKWGQVGPRWGHGGPS